MSTSIHCGSCLKFLGSGELASGREKAVEFELKSLSRNAIPEALEKAQRYRLLNEPSQAESICLDVLRVEPENQAALVMLFLSLTDQLGEEPTTVSAREVLHRLQGEYERAYYGGILAERSARVHMHQSVPGAVFKAYEEFREAMRCYEQAEALRPAGNDDAILRWNTCARTLMSHASLRPRPEEQVEPVLDD